MINKTDAVNSERNRAKVEKLINAGSYYEAFQLIRFLYHRYTLKKKLDEACSLCIEYAEKLADKKEYDLSVELAVHYIKILIKNEMAVTEERVENIKNIFNKYPSFKAKRKYKFMNKALGWVKCVHNEEVEKELHLCIANAYINENNFGNAQGHLVLCHDGVSLANMIKKWRSRCYPSEKHLLSLRVVLILLYLNDLTSVETFLNELDIDLDSVDVHPCIQFAYLLFMACKYKNKEFYETIKKKYSLIIRRDLSFDSYISELEKKYFGSAKNNNLNLFNLLSGLMNVSNGVGDRTVAVTES